MEVGFHGDSDPDSIVVFSDNSTKSNDSSISDEPYLPLNVLFLVCFHSIKMRFL